MNHTPVSHLRNENKRPNDGGQFCITLRGRKFSRREIRTIVSINQKHYNQGRTFISIKVCESLDWKQPNGWLKDRACREVLLKLEEAGIISLPPRKSHGPRVGIQKNRDGRGIASKLDIDQTPLTHLDLSTIELEYVKGTVRESIWNAIVNEYHYLGFKCFVGRSMKYIIRSKGRVLGCIGFTAPSWTVGPRDNLFNKLAVSKEQIRERGINNGRFLLLPWIHVPNLASRVLSLATKRVVIDWREYYSIELLFLETYVDPTRYIGTSYQAANWLLIGQSRGYKKSGSMHHNSQSPKDLYIYPIRSQLRQNLHRLIKESNASHV